MPSAQGYSERGVASWYGKKFHGNLTSNREVYDMYAMTAAHTTLPLPTYVQVRNLRNNKTIIVRVNDRGPFLHNRIIDLSYAAALKLDMVKDGTSLVEVTAINFDEPTRDVPVRNTTPAQPDDTAAVSEPSIATTNVVYAQVGAFGSRENAQRRLDVIQQAGISNSRIHEDRSGASLLYRVRIGPIREVLQYDLLVDELESLGIEEAYLVTE
jgi:rare lipoprotein A